jgi:hypothetical protein
MIFFGSKRNNEILTLAINLKLTLFRRNLELGFKIIVKIGFEHGILLGIIDQIETNFRSLV